MTTQEVTITLKRSTWERAKFEDLKEGRMVKLSTDNQKDRLWKIISPPFEDSQRMVKIVIESSVERGHTILIDAKQLLFGTYCQTLPNDYFYVIYKNGSVGGTRYDLEFPMNIIAAEDLIAHQVIVKHKFV